MHGADQSTDRRQSLYGRLAAGLLIHGVKHIFDPGLEKFMRLKVGTKKENPEERKISHCWTVSPQGCRKSDVGQQDSRTWMRR